MPLNSQAGGSGLNTVVIVNQISTNSLDLGNYYAELRQVPPENLLRISWAGDNISWSGQDFTNSLLNPLLTLLTARQISNQIQYVVLSMDIPFKTVNGSTLNSTTAAMFYGLKPDAQGNLSSYAGSETAFSLSKPLTPGGYSFLCTMLTGNSLAEAKSIIDHGVNSDGTLPNAPVILEKTSDTARNIRYTEFDNAIFSSQVLGNGTLVRTNSDTFPPLVSLFGFQTGLANLSVPAGAFAPGAIADSLTSFGGVIFGPNGQTSLLAFTGAGASGSFGTVDEPFSDTQKFPDSQVYFYQARGFTLAEAYYQSISVPYLGLIVGEPLAAPFAQSGRIKLTGIVSNAVLSGTVSLTNTAFASHPVQRMEFFVDGNYLQTITNLNPRAGNALTVTFQGYPISYTVPTNATLGSVVTGLTARINTPWLTNITKIAALARGDRIELRSMNTNYPHVPYYYVDFAATNTGQSFYRVVYAPFPDRPRFNYLAYDQAGGARMQLESIPGVPYLVEASTNLTAWAPIATNAAGGEISFLDYDATNYPYRFYRLVGPNAAPRLTMSPTNGVGLNIHVQSQTPLTCLLQASTNFQNWTSLSTNGAGGGINFFEPDLTKYSTRYYRAVALEPILAPATVTVVSNTPYGGNLVSVANPARSYSLQISTNGVQWTTVVTNSVLTGGSVSASASVGSADALTTSISAAQPQLMDSPALGLHIWSLDGTTHTNSWLRLTINRTNGLATVLGVTNAIPPGSIATMTTQLLNKVSAEPSLQGPDGITWADLSLDPFGAPSFQFYARTPGLAAAGVTVQMDTSSDISLYPAGAVTLTQNLSDLQPRNHLYLATGQSTLNSVAIVNTASLADGYHNVAFVAYEGTSVACQTVAILPVRVQNSSLAATIALLDLPDTASVNGTYHIQVTANTNTVTTINLFSTGGILAAATNQSSATFAVDGAILGAGLHPFFAEVQTSDGLRYRTETKSSRLAR